MSDPGEGDNRPAPGRLIPPPGTLKQRINYILSHDAHPLIQFIKYGVAGCLATLTHILVFALVSEFLLPVEKDSMWNYTLTNAIAFIPSCLVAYITNILWVFKPGRHDRRKEIFLFFAVSLIAFVFGTPLGQFLVHHFEWVGLKRFFALGVTIVASVMVNYTCRKFLIFKG